MYRLSLGMALATASLTAAAAPLPDSVEIVTENLPPFQYVENGVVTGRATEVVRAVLEDAHIKGNFRVLPWARATMLTQKGENVLIYTIDRTPEREPLYQWIGQITVARSYLYALKSAHMKLANLAEAKKYVVGTVIGDVREGYFIRHGFGIQDNIVSVSSSEQNYRKLKAGRISLWPMEETVMSYIVRMAGGDPSELEPVLELKDLSPYGGSFMAMSLKSDETLVIALRRSLERIKADGRFTSIQAGWSR